MTEEQILSEVADQGKPEFTVTDKRSGAATGEPSAPLESEAELGDDSGAQSEEEGAFAPDPAVIIAYAAMQMKARELASLLPAIFDGYAWRALGLLADPQTGEAKTDLPTAQFAIDCIQFFFTKIESDLTDSQRREVQRRLTDLRMNYLAKMQETSAKTS